MLSVNYRLIIEEQVDLEDKYLSKFLLDFKRKKGCFVLQIDSFNNRL